MTTKIVIAVCTTVAFIALIAAFVIVTTRTDTEPQIFFEFLASPTIGNLASVGAITYLTIVNRKVTGLSKEVKSTDQRVRDILKEELDKEAGKHER
jgi:hypothetical protein